MKYLITLSTFFALSFAALADSPAPKNNDVKELAYIATDAPSAASGSTRSINHQDPNELLAAIFLIIFAAERR